MENQALIQKIMDLKRDRGYTLHDLSRELDIQITTIERWFKTKRINKVYARVVRDRLKIKED